MDDERQTDQELEEMQNRAKSKHNELNKKNLMKLLAVIKSVIAAIITFIQVFWPLIIAAIVILAITYILDKEGNVNTSNYASEAVIENNTKIETGTNGYYFSIDKNVINEYMKYLNEAYYKGVFHFKDDELDKKDFVYDPENADINEKDLEEWFKTKDYKKYLIKMIRAQIASSYPKLGGETGTVNQSIDPINPVDENGNYVQQGIAEVHRQRIESDGTVLEENPLQYIPYDELKALIDANDTSALDCFSFKPDTGLIYYATYQKTTVTLNKTELEDEGEYKIREDSKSYKTITNLCDMPFNFLFVLLQQSENPEYVMAVIDLLLEDSQVVLMIQDELTVTTTTEEDISSYVEKNVETPQNSEETSEEGAEESESESTTSGEDDSEDSEAEEEKISYSLTGEQVVDTKVTTIYRNTANVFIKFANTWCVDFAQAAAEPINHEIKEGEKNEIDYASTYTDSDFQGLEYSDPESEESTIEPSDSESEESTGPLVGDEKESKESTTYTSNTAIPVSSSEKIDVESYTWDIVTVTEKQINHEKFLGLWKNADGKYTLGCRYDANGKLVKFDLPEDSDKEFNIPATVIPEYDEQRIDTLIDLLAECEDTETQEKLMKYYWYIYTGENVYDVEVDDVLNYFNTELHSYGSFYSSSNLLKEYIHSWEGEPAKNEDGSKYKVFSDGYGNPTVGWGVDINSHAEAFSGLPTEIGAEIDIDFVDAIEEQEIQEALDYIRAATAGLNLKEYQIHALVCRAYNCGRWSAVDSLRGNPKLNFMDSYNKYWNEETDNLFDEKNNNANFSHDLYIQYMSTPYTAKTPNGPVESAGLRRRRESEWILFQTGYYNTIDQWYVEGADKILSIADKIHKYMEDEKYTYCAMGTNRSEECEKGEAHGLNTTFEASKNGIHHTCCATYVSWVLQEAGYLKDSEHRDSASDLSNLLTQKGWTVINSVSELMPGDVIHYNGHIEIYAGDGKVYNAGWGGAIRGASPEYKGYKIDSMLKAFRAPEL